MSVQCHNRFPSWYDLRCCQDVKLQQLTNYINIYIYIHTYIRVYISGFISIYDIFSTVLEATMLRNCLPILWDRNQRWKHSKWQQNVKVYMLCIFMSGVFVYTLFRFDLLQIEKLYKWTVKHPSVAFFLSCSQIIFWDK